MENRPKTVWVLGSGFSKSLGGPLLDELLSRKALTESKLIYPTLPQRGVVYSVYRSNGPHGGQTPYWADAEQFLEFVDSAQKQGSPRRAILDGLLQNTRSKPSVEEFRALARLSIAAECCGFTKFADTDDEVWHPYNRWAAKLRPDDTVLTFNYDRVLEVLCENVETPYLHADSFHRPDVKPAKDDRFVSVFKLHGSVDWAYQENPDKYEMFDKFERFAGLAWTPLVATPGNTKRLHCANALAKIWEAGTRRLTSADVIVFVGYRFPPSDSEALARLLSAIKKNSRPLVKVHTILGPDTNKPDTVRLTSLLTHTFKAAGRADAKDLMQYGAVARKPSMFSIVAQPLYAQDFFTVMSPSELFDPQLANLIAGSQA